LGGCRLGALSGDEVELGNLLALLLPGDQRRAAVELVHDLKDVLFEIIRPGPCREQSTNPKMRHCTLAFGDERISRLLDSVVDEYVCVLRAEDEAGPDRLPEGRVRRLLGTSVKQIERSRLSDIPQAGERSQSVLSRMGQTAQLRSHEIRYVVGEALGADAWQVPGPVRRAGIEREQRLFCQGDQELDREERIAIGLLEHQVSQ